MAECRVSKKGCYGKLKPGQLFYRVRISDGSKVLVCHACLRGGAPFESIVSSGVQGKEEEDKPKRKPAKRTNVVDTKEQERKELLRSALEDAKEEEVSDDG